MAKRLKSALDFAGYGHAAWGMLPAWLTQYVATIVWGGGYDRITLM